ncbi:MAG: type II toxin-antitoxin system VapC family toxin [Isosphaeraceae bacterium]
MKLLLDTHTFLWLVEGSPKLSATAAAAIADPVNELFLSVASVWELAIKTGNKKLKLSDPLDVYVARWTPVYQIDLLPIQSSHALAVTGLPDHHRDPFDRMLISQSQIEGIILMSGDTKLAPYGIPILW